MNDLNAELMLGFLIWSVFCLLMLAVERVNKKKWKRAATAMESHAYSLKREVMFWSGKAGDLQAEINRRDQRLWDSVPKGVITHDKKR
jgi:hypothetical protein